jgi:hypothetical protein
MRRTTWLRSCFVALEAASARSPRRRSRSDRPALSVEALEARTLPASTLQAISVPAFQAGPPPMQTAAKGASNAPSVSADGRFVAFTSTAGDVVPGQVNAQSGVSNVFLLDRMTGTTTLISRSFRSTASNPTSGDADSFNPILSSDGNFIAFTSAAADFLQGMTQTTQNVFLYNRTLNTITLVSHRAGNLLEDGHGDSVDQGFSGDGRYLVFGSRSGILVTGQVNSPGTGENEFLYDRGTGITSLVSHSRVGAANTPANTALDSTAVISADGNFVAFTSDGTDLVANQTGSVPNSPSPNVFLYNRVAGTNTLLSGVRGSPSMTANQSGLPAINNDGSVVAFASYATNLIPGQVAGASSPVANVFLFRRTGGTLTLVSHANGLPSTTAHGTSSSPTLSGDGNLLAFKSTADNLIPGQTGGNGSVTFPPSQFDTTASNVFLFNASSNQLILVSHVSGQPTTAAGSVPLRADVTDVSDVNQLPHVPTFPDILKLSLSTDGHFLAYHAQATNLVPGQTGRAGIDNVFLYDTQAGSTVLVSGSHGSGSAGGNGRSVNPVLNRDGTFLAFTSLATDLTDPSAGVSVTNGQTNVWLYTRTTPAVQLVSHSAMVVVGAGAESHVTSVSADGRYAVFTSTATNLVPGQVDANFSSNVFLFDRETNTTTLVSHVTGAPVSAGDQDSGAAAISADGSIVTFVSYATNLVPGQTPNPTAGFTHDVYRYNRKTDTTTLVSGSGGSAVTGGNDISGPEIVSGGQVLLDTAIPAISADGRYIAFSSFATDLLPGSSQVRGTNVFLHDAVANTLTLVSHVSGDPTRAQGFAGDIHGAPAQPILSDDGRFVVFEYGPDFSGTPVQLVPGQATSAPVDVYRYDRTTGTNRLVSHTSSSTTTGGDNGSHDAVISADGSTVAFASQASNLVAGQSGQTDSNVFLYNAGDQSVTLVSHASGSTTITAGGRSISPAINGNGQFVAFASEANDLMPGVVNPAGSRNVYEYSRQTGQSTLVSTHAGSRTIAANGDSDNPKIDDTGSLIAYQSLASELVPGQVGGGLENVFVWDRTTGNNVLASGHGGSNTVVANGASFGPLLSRHSFPFFSSNATDLVANLPGGTNAFVNAIVQVQITLAPATIPDGAAPGTVVGAFTITITQGPVGQLRLPTLAFGAGGADNAAFSLTPVTTTAPATLVLQVSVNRAVKASYAIVVTVDLGLGDLDVAPFTLPVTPSQPPIPGASTVGVFDPGTATWYLRNSDSSGSPDFAPFVYGAAGWRAVVGDWNGDRVTTVGVFDPSAAMFYLRNANSSGVPDAGAFAYGAPGWIPLAGDWAGSGKDTIGVFDPGTATWYLRKSNTAGAPDAGSFQYGVPGWIPVVGKWDGKTTGIGVVDPTSGMWYLRRTATGGAPDFATFGYGGAGWRPIVGDWGGTGRTGVGVFDPSSSTWYLRNSASPGAPDHPPFSYGLGIWQPLGGAWIKAGTPQRAAVVDTGDGVEALRAEQLAPVLASALSLLQEAGLPSSTLATLAGADFQVAALPDGLLAETVGSLVTVDATAQGLGWYAAEGAVPADRYDLLTVVLHELGNVAGLAEVAGSGWDTDLMTELLAPGVRRSDHLDAVFGELL